MVWVKNYIISEYKESFGVFEAILKDEKFLECVQQVAIAMRDALQNGKKIMFCGNGGSAADSQHLAAELVSKLYYDRPALNAVALTTDTSALTAIGNDYGYDKVFSRQVAAIGQKGDVLIGFSTSGRSKNVILAFEEAKKMGITTVGFLGINGRDIGALSDLQVNIPSDKTPKIQEGHIATGHIVCAIVENEIFGARYAPKK